METTFVRLESLTYFSLTPIPLFGSGYAGLGIQQMDQTRNKFVEGFCPMRDTLFDNG